MPRELKTVEGTVSPGGDFEFYSNSESSMVKLGVLEAMPIEQFCDYATLSLIRAIRESDSETAAKLGYAIGRLDAWMEKPRPTVSTPRPASPYNSNPFAVFGKGEEVTIAFGTAAKGYIVKLEEFMDFAIYVFKGGNNGWTLMPSNIPSNVNLLKQAVLGI